MLTWNKIPLPIERPQVEVIDAKDLEACVADYTASLLSRFGDIVYKPASSQTVQPLLVLELPEISLIDGGSLYIGQLPLVGQTTITEPRSYSISAYPSTEETSLNVAVRERLADKTGYVVDDEGCRLDYTDLLELTAAVMAVRTDFNDSMTEYHEPYDLSQFPMIADDISNSDSNPTFTARRCIRHIGTAVAVPYRPENF